MDRTYEISYVEGLGAIADYAARKVGFAGQPGANVEWRIRGTELVFTVKFETDVEFEPCQSS